MMDTIPGGFESQEFRDGYWRKRPGVVRRIFDESHRPLDPARFEAALLAARSSGSAGISETAGTFFIERVDRHCPWLAPIMDAFRPLASGAPIWCDAVRALKPGEGIGCHFDDSDNFVFQLEGTKTWKVHPPDYIPPGLIRRRMLQEKGVGSIFMPEDTCLEVLLEAGDALYLPILWPHWGIARDACLSLSVVVNAMTLVRSIREELQQWEDLPGCYLPLASVAGMRVGPEIVGSLSQGIAVEPGVSVPKGPSPMIQAGTHVTPGAGPALEVDVAALRVLVDSLRRDVDLSTCILPGDGNRPSPLLDRFSALMLKRFFKVLAESFARIEDPATRTHLSSCARILGRAPAETLANWVRRPMQTAWVYQMAHALQFNYPPRHEEVARHLGNGVLDLIIKSGMAPGEGEIQLALSESVLELPWARGRWRMPVSGLDRASLDFTGYDFRITGPAGNALGTAVHEGGSVHACQGLALENLEVIDGTDITITHRNPTLLAFYPKDPIARANPLGYGRIAESFGVSYLEFQWRNVLFFGFFSVGIVFFGSIIGQIGLKRSLLAGQVLFILSTLVSWAAREWHLFLVAQSFQAIADGLIVPAQMALIRKAVSPDQLGWAFGWFEGCLALAGLIGPAAGGFLLAAFGWRIIFPVLTAVALLCLLGTLSVALAFESPSDRGGASLLSATFLLLFILCLQPCLGSGTFDAIGIHRTGAVVLLVALAALLGWSDATANTRGVVPLVPWRGFLIPAFGLAVLRIFLVFLVTNGLMLHQPSALQVVTTLGAKQIGWAMTAVAVLSICLQPILGRLSDRREMIMIFLGLSLMTGSTALLALMPKVHSPLSWLAFLLSTTAIGAALFAPAQLRRATIAAPEEDRNHFMGFYMFIQFSSGAFAGPILGAVIQDPAVGTISRQSFTHFIALCSSLLVLALSTPVVPAHFRFAVHDSGRSEG